MTAFAGCDIDLKHLNHGRKMVLAIGCDATGASLYLENGKPEAPETPLDLAAVRKLQDTLRAIEVLMLMGKVKS